MLSYFIQDEMTILKRKKANEYMLKIYDEQKVQYSFMFFCLMCLIYFDSLLRTERKGTPA